MTNYDLIIIGAGAAGNASAAKANKAGLNVALIERDAIGGTCANYGCDPTKTALHAAKILYEAQKSQLFGESEPDDFTVWRWLQARIQAVYSEMHGGSEEEVRQQKRESGIALHIGQAEFVSAHEVTVNGRSLQADHILIATGAEPAIPEIPGLQESGLVTNKNIFDLPYLPESLAVMGGGPVGVEFAQMFTRLNVPVHLFEAADHILPKDDPELAAALTAVLTDEGITIHTHAKIIKVTPTLTGKQLTVSYENGYEQQIEVSKLLVAAGRKPAIAQLNLAAAGVAADDDGHIQTDESLRTTVPHIWAAGDVTSSYPFTHTAWRQGEHVVENIVNNEAKPFHPGPIPWVTYTDPELAHVGQTEKELKEAGTPYRILTQPMAGVSRAIINGQTNGHAKLLIGADDHILGGSILAANGGELLGPILLAMTANIPVTQLAAVVWPYPSLSTIWGKTSRSLTS